MKNEEEIKENETPGNVFSKRQIELVHQQVGEAIELARRAEQVTLSVEDTDKFVRSMVRSIQLAGVQDTAFSNVRESLSAA